MSRFELVAGLFYHLLEMGVICSHDPTGLGFDIWMLSWNNSARNVMLVDVLLYQIEFEAPKRRIPVRSLARDCPDRWCQGAGGASESMGDKEGEWDE